MNVNATPPATRTVLIIEDSLEDQAKYKSIFAQADDCRYSILEADCLTKGVLLWRDHRPDCVLLDDSLPDSDGLSALRAIIAEAGADACAIVMLSSASDIQLAIEAMKSGAHDYLDKRCLTDQILLHAFNNAIEKVIAQRQIIAQQRQLAESEARFAAAFHNSSALMSIVSEVDVKYLDVNRACCEFFGVTRAEVIGHSPSEFDFYADPAQRQTLRELLNRDGHVHNFEVRWKVKDGSTRMHMLNADRITLNGQPCLFVVSNDINERKAQQQALERSEARLRRVFESNVVGMIRWDLDRSLILEANAEFFRMTGYTSEDLADDLVNFRALTPPEWTSRNEDGIRTIREQGFAPPYEKEYFRKDGSRVALIIAGTRFEDSPSEGMSFLIDISEAKRAEAERERLLAQALEAREAAEGATHAKDEFLAVVSHELRNPLSSILGYARIVRKNPHNPVDVERYCEIIERSARMQQQLIEDLLDTARIISGKLQLEVAPTDLRIVLEDALAVVRPAAEAKQIDLVAHFAEDVQQVIGDAARLQQIVWNLLQNAIKFTPNGGRVGLRVKPTGQHVHLIVTDTGKGIEQDFMPAIFDRFSQKDSSRTRRYGGLGLGLALAKQLVELHGGTIAAASPGKDMGSTFTVTLPLRAPQTILSFPNVRALAEINDSSHTLKLSRLPRLTGVRALVVDDQEEARTLVAATLEERGAKVTMAASGPEALAWVETATFDVLVCDIAMPDIDGYEVLRCIRALEAQRGLKLAQRLPAVALTALSGSEDRLRALSAGFQMHTAKPVEPSELIMVIASLIENRM